MKLNKLVLMCGLVVGVCCGGAAVPAPIQVPSEAFAPKGGHIQGMAVTEDAIYLSQQSRLIKTDWQGKVLKTAPVLSHTGDLCWWKGELFAAVAAYGGPHKGKGLIQVYDADLKLVREKVLDRTIDGIACREGVLYVGMGAKVQPSKDPHRVNIFGRFDAKTLEEVGPRFDVDYGFETNYGAQDVFKGAKVTWRWAGGAENGYSFIDMGGAIPVNRRHFLLLYGQCRLGCESLRGGRLPVLQVDGSGDVDRHGPGSERDGVCDATGGGVLCVGCQGLSELRPDVRLQHQSLHGNDSR